MTNSSQDSVYVILQLLVPDIISRYGTRGLTILKGTLYRFGLQEGRKIRAQTESMCLEPNLYNFLKFNKIFSVTLPDVGESAGYEIYRCPIEDNRLDENKVEVGRMLCLLDRAMLQGYNPAIAGRHSNCIRLGSHSSYFVSGVIFNETTFNQPTITSRH